jgi:dihydroorotase/N-acyl-D-amino-acid deacylase
MRCDLIVRGGLVFDGLASPPRAVDVGVRGEEIVAVGDLAGSEAEQVIDAGGQAVAPGFIDCHTHSDLAFQLADEHADLASGAVRQGVTTEIAGNCGFSVFPVLPATRPQTERYLAAMLGPAEFAWNDLDGYAHALRARGSYANVATLVGHGTLRAAVLGFDDRAPDRGELDRMVGLVGDALDQGAVGLSSGLIYSPGLHAASEELAALCGAVGGRGRPYTTHMRSETRDLVAATVETLAIGRDSGVPLHISHHKAAGRANWGRTQQTLGLIDAASAEGVAVTMDVYPYTAGSTILGTLLPPWVLAGGAEAVARRLGSPAERERIRRDLEHGLPGWENFAQAAGWEGVVVAACPDAALEGRSLAEIAADDDGDPADLMLDLLLEHEGRVTVVLHFMDEADVRRVIAHPLAMIASDGIPLPGKPHPRWCGTFARVLGRYTRDEGLLDLATAIAKMTSMPAERFGLRGRGRIAEGATADLVVFDPDVIADRATFTDPLAGPSGMHRVIVNGQVVVADGALTGRKPGTFVRSAGGAR